MTKRKPRKPREFRFGQITFYLIKGDSHPILFKHVFFPAMSAFNVSHIKKLIDWLTKACDYLEVIQK